ncbi:MAG: ABC transporter ATP-binding protein [Methanocellales archaeon]
MIRIENLEGSYESFKLFNISFEIQKGEIFAILGPTGAGKTMLLEAIAGILQIKKGRILLDEKELTKLPPEKRGIGMVFQDCALFPHLSVRENIAFGLEYRKLEKSEVEGRVQEIAQLLNISHLLGRMPSSLSGGEKQRVALARALVIQPEILLLDEPLSALDARTREELKMEIKGIVKKLNIPTLYVTHDQQEAFAIADRIAIMNQGKILQIGKREEIFYSPSSEFVARFLGIKNVFEGVVISNSNGLARIKVKDKEVEAICNYGENERVKICIRPENVVIALDFGLSSTRNKFEGKITNIELLGATARVVVDIDSNFELEALLTRRSVYDLGLAKGKIVNVSFKATNVHVIKE